MHLLILINTGGTTLHLELCCLPTCWRVACIRIVSTFIGGARVRHHTEPRDGNTAFCHHSPTYSDSHSPKYSDSHSPKYSDSHSPEPDTSTPCIWYTSVTSVTSVTSHACSALSPALVSRTLACFYRGVGRSSKQAARDNRGIFSARFRGEM